MKIERLNENQIRCTLNKSDLASRQLKINELAYGSDKAKELFRDMMQQASYELGFEAEDTPLMIEAIPVSSECIVLIVTKVDNPEELDTRFSRFSPSVFMKYAVLALNYVVYWNIFMVLMAMEYYTWILSQIILCLILTEKLN